MRPRRKHTTSRGPSKAKKIEPRKFNNEQLNNLFTSIMTSKAKLVAQRGQVDQPAKAASGQAE